MSSDSDYHLGCDSLVRITPEDLTGPFSYLFEWADHPDVLQVKVGSCELAAEHGGPCEMYVDASTHTGESRRYWLTWHGAGRRTASAPDTSGSPTTPAATSRARTTTGVHDPVGHRGGHSFTVSVLT